MNETAQPPNLLKIAGPTYFPIAFMARLPFAMNVVGVMTIIVMARESIFLGGLTAAAVGFGTAVFGPLLGAAADRWGQRGVMLVAAIGNSIALTLMAFVAFSSLSDGWVLAVAVLVGATAPQVAPLSRTRLIAMIRQNFPAGRQSKAIQGTLAYESSADEIVFVFGPVVVGLLATMNPVAPLIAAAVLTLIFVVAFALHSSATVVKSNASARATGEIAPVSALLRPRVIIIVLGMLGVGFFFGSTLTSLTAFMADRGSSEQAGLLYGIMGIGSAILALSVAFFPATFTLRWRWIAFALIMAGGSVLISMAHDVPSMLLALAVTGIGIGPIVVNGFSLASERTPPGRAATLMTMVGSSVIVGQSASSAIVGGIAESTGTSAALYAPLASALIVLLCGVINVFLTGSSRTRSA